jgi:16S rRNA (cytosine1402-N4)-methyltransferase
MMAGRGIAAGGLARHIPVLLPEAVSALSPRDGGVYIDATFGGGSYTQAILEAADCVVLAIDRDPTAFAARDDLKTRFGARLMMEQGRFSDMRSLAARRGVDKVDGIAMDIGVSSMQIDEAERGFSFMQDGPLDMRMSASGSSAADIVNSLAGDDLAEIISVLGEDRRARAIARAIVKAREEEPIARTSTLAAIVERVLGRKPGDPKHPATRTFQALRLFVNGELDELAQGLEAAERMLASGGRLVVVTFHSLEDRIAKRFFAERAKPRPQASRHLPEQAEGPAPSFTLLTRKPVEPGAAELRANPRARSARLRAGTRTDAPAHPFDPAALGLPSLPVPVS